jgi:hypothetical protein
VAFSCKGRVCPSCWARRTAETAADLVDRVLPEAPYRQWVLTFPWELRFLLAVEPDFLSEMLAAFLRTVFAWQRLQGRRHGLRGEAGSVTFTQRFGGIFNRAYGRIAIRPYIFLPDGLFVPTGDDTVEFAPLPPPTDADIVGLTEKLARRLGEIARRRLARDEDAGPDPDQQAVRATAAEALRIPLARVERTDDGHVGREERKALCARVDGFSLHAARTVAPHDRQGLERLCRYGLRAPFSVDRLSTTPDGRVRRSLGEGGGLPASNSRAGSRSLPKLAALPWGFREPLALPAPAAQAPGADRRSARTGPCQAESHADHGRGRQ